MKYYLIVGEASGDLHASHLMAALKAEDPQADFRFFGGDLMAAVGGTMVKHYKELAYMGFIPVLLHLRTIFANMKRCKGRYCFLETGCCYSGRLSGIQSGYCQVCPCKDTDPGLLLYFSEDMGVERIPHQEYKTRCRRAFLHSSF